MSPMLTISSDTLPQTCLSYLAFRVAFHETLERIALANQFGEDPHDCYGYLTEVPFLRTVPAHVQLDLLAETWARHVAQEEFTANLVDESIVYATCETSARFVEEDAESVLRWLEGGPLDVEVSIDEYLASELRSLHLNLSNEGDFLMISQFEDLPPHEARKLKREFDLDDSRFEVMFDVLGRWSMSPDFLSNLSGLLTGPEVLRAVSVFGVK